MGDRAVHDEDPRNTEPGGDAMSATMLKPNTTSATVTRFDPLDRRWIDNTKKTKVSVPIGPTLRQMLKTLMRTAGQQEHDLRVRVVHAQDGLRIMLFGRGVHVEVGGLRHAGGTKTPTNSMLTRRWVRAASTSSSAFSTRVAQGMGETPLHRVAGKQAKDASHGTGRSDEGPGSLRGALRRGETVRPAGRKRPAREPEKK